MVFILSAIDLSSSVLYQGAAQFGSEASAICLRVASIGASIFGKIVTAISAGHNLYRLGFCVYRIVTGNPGQKIKSGLEFIERAGAVIFHIRTAATWLEEWHVLNAAQIAWTAVLLKVKYAFSAVTFIIHAKGVAETHSFKKMMRATLGEGKVTPEGFNAFMHAIDTRESAQLKRELKIHSIKLKKRLVKVTELVNAKLSHPLEEVRKEGRKDMKKVVHLFQRRVRHKFVYHAVTMATAVVGMAILSLMLVTPAAPAVIPILSTGFSVIHPVRDFLMMYASREFKRKIGMKKLSQREASLYKNHNLKRIKFN